MHNICDRIWRLCPTGLGARVINHTTKIPIPEFKIPCDFSVRGHNPIPIDARSHHGKIRRNDKSRKKLLRGSRKRKDEEKTRKS